MLKEIVANSAYFGVVISLLAYYIGVQLRKKLPYAVFNPLLIAMLLTIAFLKLLKIDFESYNASAKYLSWLLTPATVCLAIPLYRQLQLLKNNLKAILMGILAGILANMCCILLLALVFRLNHAQYITLLPKSVTTAIGMPLANELGGYGAITAVVICITGLFGHIFAEGFLRLIRVTESVARGVALGTSSHAFGTTRALEMGEVEGAMSSLSLVVTGLLTVIAASVFAQFI